ncbi:putative proline-rich receptor-like protein kinase PERK11 RLK-Pelle-PERK-1 family [Arabidopsis thaliana]|uniref:Putative proline-rich receptor-like protein kinase PERK11 n=4 Tax=Arabidopsis TaxID=3701 RepID=PEK11_ARATH|nr:Protein kinase superfamily protein [Arabidopsis thaliana]Q9SGY7.2 RecName: Full=Putative proline-rich receptor-like protein kinase PERK11; AltName: Full=Proline-rich extensin-like receptor kinase 11; Short=AtPERK11 [Arabidopsis thaliana]KAG7596567.1 Serine-threonine/tyrosine-protein kinase catalytic domain [Arabidopsis suecica]KAG7645836.1 Protein kinase domain [Arabidopsis thaliana x Arabidopsis arenosa]AEE28610.1 Protein kinase superfamily protein [Arabidopsis thaliana]OAP14111.1 PERK11 [|eukprot:NP_172532.1 Protein kinase superfamily protein [Arabidopsis thaliana]
MDKVQQQADLFGKTISPFVASQPTNVGGFTDQKIIGGSETTQPPATSPPSPPSPDTQTSPPPATAAQPPPNQPPNTTPPPTPPSSPPPSITPPPSPPQPQPPPQSTPTGDSPVVIPFPKPQLPPPSLFPPPSLVNQLPDPRPNDNNILEPINNPISLPSPPSTPFSPPSQENSGSQGSPPLSSLLPPMLPLNPNSPGNPLQPLDSPLGGESNRVPSSSSSPSPPSLSGSNNHSGGSNRHNANSNGDGGTSQQSNESNYTEKTVIGIGIAGVLVILFIAGVFFVRRKQKKGSSSPRSNQYLPPANVSVNTEGFIHYRQKPGNGNSSAQNSSPDTNSLGNPKHGRGTPDSAVIGTSKIHFTYEELSQITEGFCKSFVVGEGGFGCVYKGILFEGKPVAIKQLKSVSAEGYREFKAEVEIISRVHHRHLVSLVGYCISEQHRFLIYEFVPNNTLDYHLHGKNLPVLEWSRRVRIAIGAAKGLAYLHEDCHPKIIHRDIKSSNILLDDEFEAQVADFGLARLNDTAQSHISTRVMGTFGYLAPEYASSGKLTDRSDVFSFGVVLLELITGRKPVDTSQPLGEESLVEWARPRLIEAIEKGDISEVVDPRLENDYVESEVYKMIETAASCVRHSALKRPRMVQVVRALDTRDDLSDLTNGVKVGQSRVYDSGQYSNEIRIFRRASEDSSDLGTNTGYYPSQDYATSHEYESESRAFNTSHRNH